MLLSAESVAHRIHADFMFQLTKAEKSEVVTNCDHLARLKFSPVLPCAFTEYGALMLGNVLKPARPIGFTANLNEKKKALK